MRSDEALRAQVRSMQSKLKEEFGMELPTPEIRRYCVDRRNYLVKRILEKFLGHFRGEELFRVEEMETFEEPVVKKEVQVAKEEKPRAKRKSRAKSKSKEKDKAK